VGVRASPAAKRIPHLRVGSGWIRLVPEHVAALLTLITVECSVDDGEPPGTASTDLSALQPTVSSLAGHRRGPDVAGSVDCPGGRHLY
jgi:hypothetical protein